MLWNISYDSHILRCKITTNLRETDKHYVLKKLTANIILNINERLNAFSLIGNKAWMSALTRIIQYSARTFNQCNKARKEMKGMYIRMEDIKLLPSADDMIFYMENPKESKKLSPKPPNPARTEFSKVAE